MKKFLSTRIAVAFALSASLSVCLVTSAYAAGKPAHASSEPSIGGLTPNEYWDQQLELHEWLMSELPDGTLDAPIRVPLTGKDRRAIANDNTPKPRPHRVGIVKRVGRTVKLWRGGRISKAPARLSHGVIHGTADGGFTWAVSFESKDAAALRVHLSDVSLPDSADVYFFSLDGQAHGPYRERDAFWTNSLAGTQGIVLVRQFGPVAAGTKAMSVSVTSVANLGEPFDDAAYPLCPNNHPCIEDATGYVDIPVVADLMAATAKMVWVQGAWMYSCSGGLIADTEENSQIPYFLTANHCLKSNAAARNLELYWDFSTMNSTCTVPGGPVTMGARVKTTGPMGDFTLLELTGPLPGERMFMGWNSIEVANTPDISLHRVHHPKGAPQSYTAHVIDPNFGTCAALPIPQFIYSLDTLGSTEGGSSGSLVVDEDGQVVGQLYGGCGSNFDECFVDDWRTVDGAFAFYFNKVAPYLAPSCTPSAEVCDDGLDNDCDSDADCDDSDCDGDEACETPICGLKNAACTDESDCCSGICKRNGRCR